MKKCIFIVVLLIMSNMVFAQFSKIKDDEIKKIKQSVLVVSLEEENPKTLKKLEKKKDQLEHYKAQIAGRNDALKLAAQKYWHFSDSVIALPSSEVVKITANGQNYVILSYGSHVDYERLKTGVGANGKPAGWQSARSYAGTGPSQAPRSELVYNPSTKYTSLANVITTLRLSGFGSSKEIYLPNVYPSNTDVIYGIKQLEYMLKYYEAHPGASGSDFLKQVKQNNAGLKDKILLLDKEDIDKKLTDEKIKEVYPYKFEIVSQDFIDKVIMDESDKYVYVQIVDTPSGKGNISFHFLNNPSDGMIYCIDYPKVTFGVKGTSLITYNQRIKSKNLKNYIDNIK